MAKNLLPIDARISDLLRDGIQGAGLSYRQLAAETGMSINRIGIILRKEPPPVTVGELGLLAGAFGSTASAMLAMAEAGASSAPDYALAASDDDDWQARQEYGSE